MYFTMFYTLSYLAFGCTAVRDVLKCKTYDMLKLKSLSH